MSKIGCRWSSSLRPQPHLGHGDVLQGSRFDWPLRRMVQISHDAPSEQRLWWSWDAFIKGTQSQPSKAWKPLPWPHPLCSHPKFGIRSNNNQWHEKQFNNEAYVWIKKFYEYSLEGFFCLHISLYCLILFPLLRWSFKLFISLEPQKTLRSEIAHPHSWPEIVICPW